MTRRVRWRTTSSRSFGEAGHLDAADTDGAGELDRLRSEVDELRTSRERLVRAADEDRRRLERELHESVRQCLIALSMELQRARPLLATDPAGAAKVLDDMQRDLDLALAAAARLGQRLYPAMLAAGGLGAALRSAAAMMDVPATVEVTGDGTVSAERAAAAYLCCVEVLDQLRPGARASVRVWSDGGELRFEVVEVVQADTEPTSDPRDGSRLQRSRDRVEALGGTMTLVREPGGGFRVAGSLPAPP